MEISFFSFGVNNRKELEASRKIKRKMFDIRSVLLFLLIVVLTVVFMKIYEHFYFNREKKDDCLEIHQQLNRPCDDRIISN